MVHIFSGIWHENNTQTRMRMNMTTSAKNILDAINAADTMKKSSRLLRHCVFLGYPFSDTRGATFPPRGQLEHFGHIGVDVEYTPRHLIDSLGLQLGNRLLL